MEIQKVERFYTITDKGHKPINEDNCKETSDIFKEFVLESDVNNGIKDFYILKDEFGKIASELGISANYLQVYDDKSSPIFRIHSIL